MDWMKIYVFVEIKSHSSTHLHPQAFGEKLQNKTMKCKVNKIVRKRNSIWMCNNAISHHVLIVCICVRKIDLRLTILNLFFKLNECSWPLNMLLIACWCSTRNEGQWRIRLLFVTECQIIDIHIYIDKIGMKLLLPNHLNDWLKTNDFVFWFDEYVVIQSQWTTAATETTRASATAAA